MAFDLEQEHGARDASERPLSVALRAVLVVEDNPDDADYIVDILTHEGSALRVAQVSRISDALAEIEEATPWCVLLDLSLPDADGMEGAERLRAAAPDVPIVVLTGSDDEGTGMRALQCGVQDYLVKGKIDASLLGRAMRYAVERKRHEAELRSLTLHDPLTGLPNRVLLSDRIQHGLARLRREHTTLAVLFLDLDDFKAVNDRLGHAAGDALLEQVAQRLSTSTRPGDTVARLAGDEFAVLLENLGQETDVFRVLERIKHALDPPFVLARRSVSLGVSIGVAFAKGPQDVPEDLIAEADQAMYHDKATRRGRLLVHGVDGRLGLRIAPDEIGT